jgi:hypothetical protein
MVTNVVMPVGPTFERKQVAGPPALRRLIPVGDAATCFVSKANRNKQTWLTRCGQVTEIGEQNKESSTHDAAHPAVQLLFGGHGNRSRAGLLQHQVPGGVASLVEREDR